MGVITPPRVLLDDRMDMRRARHMTPQRRWCVGSGGVVRPDQIDHNITKTERLSRARLAASRQAVP